ncbi:MAG: hypothetical protein DIU76_11850 [Bacillota bacterium]|nr:MAG: hypothetical protein DIU76_11850 [Bacillota bacterium]
MTWDVNWGSPIWPWPWTSRPLRPALRCALCGHLTSNQGFAEWGEVPGDNVIAAAILDPLLHHGHVVNIRGESHRFREKNQAGLFRGLPSKTSLAGTHRPRLDLPKRDQIGWQVRGPARAAPRGDLRSPGRSLLANGERPRAPAVPGA